MWMGGRADPGVAAPESGAGGGPVRPVGTLAPVFVRGGRAGRVTLSGEWEGAADPRAIGGYLLEGRLGAGGMGVVYLGRSEVSGRQVAVKVIRPELAEDHGFRERFRQEVAAARQVSGAFTAAVVDADPDARAPWLATLFVPGPSLAQRVVAQGPLGVAEVRRLAAGLVEALRDIHRVGLVHRDLKPGNVLLADDGPRVIDFGIARTPDAVGLTSTGVAVGTPPFMAPEQFRRADVGPAADIFALGAVLVYAATGHGPFDGDSAHAVGFRVVYEEPDLGGLPDELRELVGACLEKEPERRAGVAGLLELLAGGPFGVVPPVTRVDVPRDGPVPVTAPVTAPGAPVPRPVTAASVPAHASPAPAHASPAPAPASPAPDPGFAALPTQPAQLPTPAASFAAPSAPPAPPTPPGTRALSSSRRRRTALVAGAGVLVAGLAAAIVVPNLPDGGRGEEPGQGAGPGGKGPTAAAQGRPVCGPKGGALHAAGVSAQRAAMERWMGEYMKKCDTGGAGKYRYQPNGSGAGIDQFRTGQSELAVVSTPLSEGRLRDSGNRCASGRALQLPLGVLPVVVVLQLPGVGTLTLDAATLARIFEGRIARWNDPAIAALNPGTPLPGTPVTVVLPADESPVNLAFGQYLREVAPKEWPHKPALAMPAALTSAKRVKDPAAEVAVTVGALTFLPMAEAVETKEKGGNALIASLAPGPGGNPVAPDAESTAAAVATATPPGTIGRDPVDLDYAAAAKGTHAYPLVQISYAVVCDKGEKGEKGGKGDKGNAAGSPPVLQAFLNHAVSGPGQRSVTRIGYGALPDALTERVRKVVQGLS